MFMEEQVRRSWKIEQMYAPLTCNLENLKTRYTLIKPDGTVDMNRQRVFTTKAYVYRPIVSKRQNMAGADMVSATIHNHEN